MITHLIPFGGEMKKQLLLILTLLFFLLLAIVLIRHPLGAGQDKKPEGNVDQAVRHDGKEEDVEPSVSNNSSDAGTSSSEGVPKTTGNLSFLDARGEFHSYVVDDAAAKNELNLKGYLYNGQSVYDSCKAIYDADLSGQPYSDESLPKTKGKEGTHNGYFDDGVLSYDLDGYTSRRGIDVSHHQGDIDWASVRASGIDFVILRIAYRGYAMEGRLNADRNFESYYQGAKAAGLDVGVYFFAQAVNETEAVEEADYVLELLNQRPIDLQVIYDPESIEDDSARTDGISGEQLTKNSIAFTDRIRAAGYQPGIYANMKWQTGLLDMAALKGIPMWCADYEPLPQTPYHYEYLQYSESGQVPGIAGNVDLDLMIRKENK